MCVSKRVDRQRATLLAQILGVQLICCHERYLGLPSFAGKNKRALFANIKDRVWDKLKGWQSKLFSIEGKKVLLKAVIQSIPTYSMSLFRFPQGLILDLHRLSAQFWWGSNEEKRRMHWGSWAKLCAGKDAGGLGFRDLSMFNKSLLAKQVWHLIHYPDTLAARILKHSYYPNSSILNVGAVGSSSFLWKSILLGRDLIEVGSRWRIGDGSLVSVYHDRWIARPSTFKILSPPVLANSTKVSDFKLATRVWDADLIRHYFLEDDANLILSIPCSIFQHSDSLLWHHDKFGSYSVRSGYHFGCMLKDSPSSSGGSDMASWWKFLWRMKIPPKIKLFVWKASHNWIPTQLNLAKRGLILDILCPLCKVKPESTLHALWSCSSVKRSRSAISFMKGFYGDDSMQFVDFMLACKCRLQMEEMELLCVFFWCVWYRRNNQVHSSPFLNEPEILPWVSSFLEEYRSANRVEEAIPGVVGNVRNSWRPPDEGVFKVNTDAAFVAGCICRDWDYYS